MNQRNSFTLIELLIVIAIIAVLATAVVLVLNPAQFMKQARDSTRLSDLNNINKAITLLQGDVASVYYGSSSVIYVSIPDTSSVCANLGLPALPPDWSYNCVTSSTLTKVDGTGWIPVNFTQFSAGAIFSKLPTDPVNTTSSNLYYTYIVGSWSLSAGLESQKYKASNGAQDAGVDATRFETGSLTTCGGITTDYGGNLYTTVQIGTQCWMGSHLYTKYKSDGTLMTNSIAGAPLTHSERSCPGASGSTTPGTEADCATYGALYEWPAVMGLPDICKSNNTYTCNGTTCIASTNPTECNFPDPASTPRQGICPVGWHIPTDTEYKTLEMTLGMSQAEADATGWRGTHSEGNQLKRAVNCYGGTSCGTSGFNGVLGGNRKTDGATFYSRLSNAHIWTSSPASAANAWNRVLYSGSAMVYRTGYDRTFGFSARCLKN